MMGRAAMQNPAMFWNVDTFFYGAPTNPSKTRRQVLDQYLVYLQQVYPRRCCDDHPERTVYIPSPKVVFLQGHCSICDPGAGAGANENHDPDDIPILLPVNNQNHQKSNHHQHPKKNKNKSKKGEHKKISLSVLQRSLGPVRNFFYGLDNNLHKEFQSAVEECIMSDTIRDCGPAFALQVALRVVPSDDLDRPFS
jgi:hypothetical protein